MRLSLAAFGAGLTLMTPQAVAQPAAWGLLSLMHDLAQVRSASARFTERSTMPMLGAPLLSSGVLSYVAPDYVRKTTASPLPEDFVLDHDKVTMTSGAVQQPQTFSLTEAPQIGGLVEGVRATLAGDLPTLERIYRVRLTGSAAKWQLLLRPRDTGLGRFLTSMLITGSGNRIDAIDTASGDGGHTEMGVVEDVSDAR